VRNVVQIPRGHGMRDGRSTAYRRMREGTGGQFPRNRSWMRISSFRGVEDSGCEGCDGLVPCSGVVFDDFLHQEHDGLRVCNACR